MPIWVRVSRRIVLAALLILAVVTASGCGGLLGGGSKEDELLSMLKLAAERDGETLPTSIECEDSDALDYVEAGHFDKAKTCTVAYEAGPVSQFCLMEGTDSGAGFSTLPDSCEAAAAGGWGRE